MCPILLRRKPFYSRVKIILIFLHGLCFNISLISIVTVCTFSYSCELYFSLCFMNHSCMCGSILASESLVLNGLHETKRLVINLEIRVQILLEFISCFHCMGKTARQTGICIVLCVQLFYCKLLYYIN